MTNSIHDEITVELRKPDIDKPVRKLYELYFETILSQITANGGSRDDGADIFQEAVLILIDKVKTGKFREESSLKTFLSGIARNLWLHESRTRSRRNQREANYTADFTEVEIADTSFSSLAYSNEIAKLMDQIGSPCKEILTGFYYEDKSMKELLTQFDYENEQVLRNRKSRCLKKLKEIIASNTQLLQTLKSSLFYE